MDCLEEGHCALLASDFALSLAFLLRAVSSAHWFSREATKGWAARILACSSISERRFSAAARASGSAGDRFMPAGEGRSIGLRILRKKKRVDVE